MKIQLIQVIKRKDDWANQGFEEYRKRLPKRWGFKTVDISPVKRNKNNSNVKAAMTQEGERILAAIPDNHYVIALDERGKTVTTKAFADKLAQLEGDGRDVSFVIGGADGLTQEVKARADFTMSLTDLTLPHFIASLILLEQLYRGHTVLEGHPYHRD